MARERRDATENPKEIRMPAFRKTILVVTLGLSASAFGAAAVAGEIANSQVNAANLSNTSAGLGSRAAQNIGVA